MPKRKVSKEQIHNKPAPAYWANEPEQFIYQKGELLIFQKDFDSLPTITISRVQLSEDANNVISWVNDNSLTGGWDKWNKIIGHSFIELMKIPVETQKELYSIYKDSMEVKLTNGIKRLKKVKKQSEKYLQTIESNLTGSLFPLLDNIKNHPEYLDDCISKYENKLKEIRTQKLGYYVFIKPYLKTILDALIDDGKKRKSQQEKAIYSLFVLYDVNDFTKIDEASAKERTRSLLNKIR